MLLCDGCDRGHHMYCLKPKLKNVPSGDWYCSDCKPKERVRSPKKKSRRVFSSAEDEASSNSSSSESEQNDEEESGAEEEEEEQMEVDQEDKSEEDSEEEEAEEEEDEDDVPLKRKAKKKVAAAKVTKETASGKKGKKKLSTISQLFGKRRCAAEANEKIARVTQQEIASGNSSGSESATEALGGSSSSSRSTRATRAKRSLDQPISRLAVPSATTSSTSSSKSSPPGSGARSKRRKAVDDELYGMFNPTVLEDLLNAMMKHKDGWPFDRPITKADAPDYHKIIKRPMDLGTIRSSINRMKYSCNQEVLEDIETVFKNCWTYNRDDAEEYMCGVRLEKFFKKEARKMGIELPEDGGDEEESSSSSSRRPPPAKKARRTF